MPKTRQQAQATGGAEDVRVEDYHSSSESEMDQSDRFARMEHKIAELSRALHAKGLVPGYGQDGPQENRNDEEDAVPPGFTHPGHGSGPSKVHVPGPPLGPSLLQPTAFGPTQPFTIPAPPGQNDFQFQNPFSSHIDTQPPKGPTYTEPSFKFTGFTEPHYKAPYNPEPSFRVPTFYDQAFKFGTGASPWDEKQDSVDRRLKSLEQSMRSARGPGGGINIDIDDLFLFPEVRLAEGFKLPKFDLYNGQGNPVAHLKMYVNKMRGAGNDKVLMAYFGQSLGASALDWFNSQEAKQWSSWKDMGNAFLKRYMFNMETAPTRKSLRNMSKRHGESFIEYVRRWQSEAAKVYPIVEEEEGVDLILETIDQTYIQNFSASISTFKELVRSGERVEEWIRTGKVNIVSPGQSNFQNKRRDGKTEVAATSSQPKRTPRSVSYADKHPKASSSPLHYFSDHQEPSWLPPPTPFQPSPPTYYPPPQNNPYNAPHPYYPPQAPHYQDPSSYPVYHAQSYPKQSNPPYWNAPPTQPPQNYPPRNRPPYQPNNQGRPRFNAEKRPQENFTPLGESYTSVFKRLIEAKALTPIPGRIPDPVPPNFDYSKRCEFHSGFPGHDTEECRHLRSTIQRMIDEGKISVKHEGGEGVTKDPMPVHRAG